MTRRAPWLGGRSAESRLAALRRLARGHRAVLGVLLVAAALRIATTVAYGPALLWSDSWAYVDAAYGGEPVKLMVDKPSGYPAIMRGLEVGGRSLGVITTAQHVAGLAVGVLVYRLLCISGVSTVLAVAATAVVLLDTYAIVLEQHILAESFFTLALMAWAFVAVRFGEHPAGVGVAGLLLAAAVSLRVVALVAVPVWVIYSLWRWPDWQRRVIAAAAVALPLLAYAALHDAAGRGFGFTEMNGYLLYSRVGRIANCDGLEVRPELRALCPSPGDERRIAGSGFRGDPEFFYFYRGRLLAGDPYGRHPDLAAGNRRVRDFALEVIKARPLRFAGLVAETTIDFVEPGRMSAVADFDRAVLFPATPRPLGADQRRVQAQFVPGYAVHIRAPAEELRDLQRWLHVPRWLVGALIVAGAVEMAALAWSDARRRLEHRREVFLLVGAGFALLVGAALNRFELRLLMPTIPLIVTGGTLAITDLAARIRPPAGVAQSVRAAES